MILEWVAISFSRGSSQPRDRTRVSCTTADLYQLSYKGSPNLMIRGESITVQGKWIKTTEVNNEFGGTYLKVLGVTVEKGYSPLKHSMGDLT